MKRFLLALLIALPSTIVLAEEAGQWYINPMIGYQWFDSERDLDDDASIGIGLEYQYNKQWGTEIKYLISSLDEDSGIPGNDADLSQIIVEGMYYLTDLGNEQFKPYLAAGLGRAEFDYDETSKDKDAMILAGAGFKYAWNEQWTTKTDYRLVGNDDDADLENMLTIALNYALGKPAAKPAPAAPADSDNDGVIDANDQCPNTPPGVQVDSRGCELDSDNDGVVNSKDQCPNTVAGAKVDAVGCAVKLTSTESISIDITFATDSDVVTDQFKGEVQKVANFMRAYSTATGVIEGHTDDTGAADYNQDLSQRRANSVRNMLITEFGISADRLQAKGFGEGSPIATNATREGRQKNRRVVAVFKAEVTK